MRAEEAQGLWAPSGDILLGGGGGHVEVLGRDCAASPTAGSRALSRHASGPSIPLQMAKHRVPLSMSLFTLPGFPNTGKRDASQINGFLR